MDRVYFIPIFALLALTSTVVLSMSDDKESKLKPSSAHQQGATLDRERYTELTESKLDVWSKTIEHLEENKYPGGKLPEKERISLVSDLKAMQEAAKSKMEDLEDASKEQIPRLQSDIQKILDKMRSRFDHTLAE